MHCVGNKFDVRVSTASTSVFAKRLFKGKPLQQQAKVVNGCMIGGLQVTGALLNITVVSREKKGQKCISERSKSNSKSAS